MSSQTKLYIGITILIVIASLIIYCVILHNKNADLEFQKVSLTQNIAALNDSINVQKGQETILAASIRDLNNNLNKEKNKNKILQAQIDVYVDSLYKRDSTTFIQNDSLISALFTGKQSIANYELKTWSNLITKKSFYDLTIGFDVIEVDPTIYKDNIDDLWKIRTISKNPNVEVKGYATIDTKMFQIIQNDMPEKKKWCGIGAIGNANSLYGLLTLEPTNELEFLGAYGFNKNWQIGAAWKPF